MNPYVIIGLLVAWLLSATGVGWWQNAAGHTAERSTWQGRENKELVDANASIKRLEEEARDTERKHVLALANIDRRYQKELQDAEDQKARDVAAARAGRIVLRIPSPCKGPDGGATSGVASTPGSGDGQKTAELPREVAANLFALADDANAVVRQLTECQAVILDDRKPAGKP